MIFFSRDGLFGFCGERAFHGFVGSAKVFPFGEEGSFFQIEEGRGIGEGLQAIQGARGFIEKTAFFLCEIEVDAETGIGWFEGEVALQVFEQGAAAHFLRTGRISELALEVPGFFEFGFAGVFFG